MSFWGVEVKPGKPVKHSFQEVKRRLRVSQATLGIGSATKTSFVQCNVGNRHPVFLCALLPDKTESCHLDLEFEEHEDVVFSVLGPRSVYLTGYYVGHHSNANFGSDTESYGEDIADTDIEKSGLHSDEDEYDASFIDDDDPGFSPRSPASSASDHEKLKHTEKRKEKNDSHMQRRKFQVMDSDDDASSQESGEEDNNLLSDLKNKKVAKGSVLEGEKIQPVSHETVADGKEPELKNSRSSKEKGGCVIKAKETESEPGLTNKKKLKRKRMEESDRNDQKEVKAHQADAGPDGRVHDLRSEHSPKTTINGNINGPSGLMHSAEMNSGDGSNRKKKSKTVGKVPTDHKAMVDDAGKISENLQEVGDMEATAERDANPDVVDGHNLQKAKKKKKKSKSHKNDEALAANGTHLADNNTQKSSKEGDAGNSEGTLSSKARKLSNGLLVEDLSSGDKDGKVAAVGKKVKIFYTAMLKGKGKVLDSNVGKSPYKFRLGSKDIIEGWNVGLEGMHVGDKRRLTVPPSMGYGSEGGGENIPPNSWVVYDIELVGAR